MVRQHKGEHQKPISNVSKEASGSQKRTKASKRKKEAARLRDQAELIFKKQKIGEDPEPCSTTGVPEDASHPQSSQLVPEQPYPSVPPQLDLPTTASEPRTPACPPEPGTSSLQPEPVTSACPPEPGTLSCPPEPGTSSLQPEPVISACPPEPGTSSCLPEPGTSSCPPEPVTSPHPPDLGISACAAESGTPAFPPESVTLACQPESVSTASPLQPAKSVLPLDNGITKSPPESGRSALQHEPGLNTTPPNAVEYSPSPVIIARSSPFPVSIATGDPETEGAKKVETDAGIPEEDNGSLNFETSDPSTWPLVLNQGYKRMLAKAKFTVQPGTVFVPVKGHKFSTSFLRGRKANMESFDREWLLYSPSTNSAFCLPCCLFSKKPRQPPWANYGNGNEGFQGFDHGARGFIGHEKSISHKESSRDWQSFLSALENPKSVVSRSHNKENVCDWRQILKSLVDAVMFLAKNNLAFRGKSGNLLDSDCGNFLNLIKLLAKYYAPLGFHVQNLKQNSPSYLSPQSQNEFITLCGDEVRKQLLYQIRARKYYSVVFDGTPDYSHQDQLCQIIRSVECAPSGCSIHENFIDFIPTNTKTGLGLFEVIRAKLEKDGLDLSDCRGQGYDNGANMAGAYSGVQARMREANPQAKFVPCAAHCLNLVGSNCAEKISTARLILGTIQNIYLFFAGSTGRWSVLTRNVKCTLKNQNDTRWSARAEAVKVISQQFQGVCQALSDIADSDSFSADVSAGANSRLRDMCNFKFLLGVTIWNELLSQINLCSVRLQGRSADISAASKHLKVLTRWLQDFKANGFSECLAEAEKKADVLGIARSTGFEDVRRCKGVNRRYMDKEAFGSIAQATNLERFKNECFEALMSKLVSEMERRFSTLHEILSDFGFLWGDGLINLTKATIKERVKLLCEYYPNDLEESEFVAEVSTLKLTVEEFMDSGRNLSEVTPMDVLDIFYKNNLSPSYSNCEIVLRIFLTMPVSVATGERSFSKLKLIKNYLRSTMGQERLNGLAILSIERVEAEKVDFDDIINKFIAAKCRKCIVRR